VEGAEGGEAAPDRWSDCAGVCERISGPPGAAARATAGRQYWHRRFRRSYVPKRERAPAIGIPTIEEQDRAGRGGADTVGDLPARLTCRVPTVPSWAQRGTTRWPRWIRRSSGAGELYVPDAGHPPRSSMKLDKGRAEKFLEHRVKDRSPVAAGPNGARGGA